MLMHLSVMRNGLTATSAFVDVCALDYVRRFIASSLRGSGADSNLYHFIAYGDLQDISGTDTLEEITGTMTGTSFKIINKREVTGSHMEFDLEKCHS